MRIDGSIAITALASVRGECRSSLRGRYNEGWSGKRSGDFIQTVVGKFVYCRRAINWSFVSKVNFIDIRTSRVDTDSVDT